jgi:phage tail sheath gpL-like
MGTVVAGSGSASISSALAACTGKRYHEIAVLIPDSTAGGVAKTHVNTESDAEHAHGEFAHQATNASQSTATTLALALNGARNQNFAINTSESWSVAIAAGGAAVMASEEVATRPLNTLVIKGIVPPPVEKRWTRTEMRTLLDNGCTPLVVTPGEEVAILRSVITGVKNAAGDYDYSTLDITITRGFDDIRDNVMLMFNSKYPRARWADDDSDGLLPPDVATPAKVTADLIDVLRDCEERGICQQVEALKDQCVVEKVGTQCQFSIPANIVDGMHEKLGKVVLFRQNVTSV